MDCRMGPQSLVDSRHGGLGLWGTRGKKVALCSLAASTGASLRILMDTPPMHAARQSCGRATLAKSACKAKQQALKKRFYIGI